MSIKISPSTKMSSLENCFARNESDCTPPCVLEYQADTPNGNPTCVPPATSLRAHRLTDDEVGLIKRIMSNLLPEVTSLALTNAFNTLHEPLHAYIDNKIKTDVETISHTTWGESSKRIAASVLTEIAHTFCFACWGDLNDRDSVEEIHTMECCGNIGHLKCIQASGRMSGGKCPWCDHLIPGFVPRVERVERVDIWAIIEDLNAPQDEHERAIEIDQQERLELRLANLIGDLNAARRCTARRTTGP